MICCKRYFPENIQFQNYADVVYVYIHSVDINVPVLKCAKHDGC